MTLFEELGVEYKEVDGILYPLLSVDEAEYNLADIGKYGWMWLRYMEENPHCHGWSSHFSGRFPDAPRSGLPHRSPAFSLPAS